MTWEIPPKPYLQANGEQWWELRPGIIMAAVHGKRSDGKRVFKTIALTDKASEELKDQAIAFAAKVLQEKGLVSDEMVIDEGSVMPEPELVAL